MVYEHPLLVLLHAEQESQLRAALEAAVHSGQLAVVRRLLDAGANASAGVGMGQSALHLASLPDNGLELLELNG